MTHLLVDPVVAVQSVIIEGRLRFARQPLKLVVGVAVISIIELLHANVPRDGRALSECHIHLRLGSRDDGSICENNNYMDYIVLVRECICAYTYNVYRMF